MPRFSEVLRDHARDPSNRGKIPDAEFVGHASLNDNPPFVTLYLSVSAGRISRAKFEAAGCGVTVAVGSVTTEMIVGKPFSDCRALTVETVCEELEGVPPDKMHCVHVVLKALSNALDKTGAS